MRRPAAGVTTLATVGLAAVLAALPPAGGRAESDSEEGPTKAAEILRRAFRQRYEIDLTSEIELQLYANGSEVERRVFLTAMSGLGEHHRAIGQIVSPPSLRGMTILSLEEEGSKQAYVYLPSLRRSRRISWAQDGNAFFGSDLTSEDFRRRHVSDCAELSLEPEVVVGEEPAHVVSCRRRDAESYERAVFVVARSDGAILEITYYGSDEDEPVRRVFSPREHTVSIDGHPLPTRLRVETPDRGTATEVTIRNLKTASLPDRLFSVTLLQSRQPDLRRVVR